MMVDGLVSQFRVYLPKGGFWAVYIFDTADSLRAWLRSKHIPGGASKHGKTLGFARALEVVGKNGKFAPLKRGRRGLVAMCLPWCRVGVASHEWTHAAFYEFTNHRRKRSVPLKDDEAFARLQGEMVRRFWLAFQSRFRQNRNHEFVLR